MTIFSERFQNLRESDNGQRVAEDSYTGETVEVYQGTFSPENADIGSLERLTATLPSLQHPNLAQVLSVTASGGKLFLVTRGDAGVPLSIYIAESRPHLDEIKALALDLTDALQYLHEQPLAGDLHVEHLFVLGGRLIVSGANFVPLPWIEWEDTSPSPLNVVLERQSSGEGDLGRDLFAVGILLYHMATGIAAGAAARAWSPAVMAFDHFLSEGVAPSSLKPSIPPAWDAAILQALSHLGQGGYPSLSAMRSAIEALPTEVIEEPSAGAPDCQAPIQPHDIGTWPRIVDEDEGDTRRPHGPRPVVIAAAAMAVLLVVLASGWFFSGFRNDSAVALSPPTASRTSLARVTGLVSAAHLVAGSAQVHLSWSPIAGADKYRVRIAHPGSKEVTAVTRASYVATHLSAGDRFTWKVAAHAHGRWGPYSTSSTNGVLAGTTVTVFPTPALRSPAQGAHIRVPVKLCWSPQRSSSGYRVLIDGHVWNASRSCLTISANPGRHHWAAAAVHKNAKHRMSPYSRVRTFTLVGNVYNAHPRTASTVAPPIQTVAVAPPVVPTAVIVVPTQVPVVVQQPTIVAVAPTQAPVVVAPQPTAGPSSGSGSQGSGSTSCIPFVNC